jgi:hypothetical protein
MVQRQTVSICCAFSLLLNLWCPCKAKYAFKLEAVLHGARP